jgi:hypothetical protein
VSITATLILNVTDIWVSPEDKNKIEELKSKPNLRMAVD